MNYLAHCELCNAAPAGEVRDPAGLVHPYCAEHAEAVTQRYAVVMDESALADLFSHEDLVAIMTALARGNAPALPDQAQIDRVMRFFLTTRLNARMLAEVIAGHMIIRWLATDPSIAAGPVPQPQAAAAGGELPE